MKLVSLRLVAAIALCLGVAQSSAVFGTCSTQPLFFTPASTAVPQVMDAINSAKKSFHMIMYRISTVAVMDALIAAKNRGVDVQVILDNAGATSEKPTGAFHTLTAAGVKVMKSSSLFSISHVKAFVVDNKTAYIMTLNLTTITPTVRDVGLITSDSNVIGFFNELFTTDVANAENTTMNQPASVPDFIVLSPGARDRLETYIKSARRNIRLQVENFSDPAMTADLIAAQKSGVKVQVLLPRCDMTSNNFDMPVAQQLAAAGVEVHMMGDPMTASTPYIHEKSIVVDDTSAFLGSENFSSNSLDHARELGIIITTPSQVKQMVDMFKQDIGVALNMKDAVAYQCPTRTFSDDEVE